MIAAAQLEGMGRAGVTGTIKHFCGNNQEYHRRFVDSVISERAVREIYLKGFEIAVKKRLCKLYYDYLRKRKWSLDRWKSSA